MTNVSARRPVTNCQTESNSDFLEVKFGGIFFATLKLYRGEINFIVVRWGFAGVKIYYAVSVLVLFGILRKLVRGFMDSSYNYFMKYAMCGFLTISYSKLILY